MTDEAVDLRENRAEQVGPGDPVEHSSITQMGGTFAERQASRDGKKAAFKKPGEFPNTTFADRAKRAAKDEKAVTSEDGDVEDKAVKKPARKSAAKK